MRVALVSHSSGLGGAERSMVALAEEFAGRGHSLHVFLPGIGPLQDELKRNVAAYEEHITAVHRWMSPRGRTVAGVVRLFQCMGDVRRFVDAFRRIRPDVVVVNSSVIPAPMLASRVLRIPGMTVVREMIKSTPGLRSLLPKRVIRRLIWEWNDSLACVSPSAAAEVGGGQVVWNDVRLDGPIRRDKTGSQLRAVMLGALDRNKGQRDGVRAVHLARRAGYDVRLDIYGPGARSERRRIRRLIAALRLGDAVAYHGEIRDVAQALSRADVLLMASLSEAFGRVTVEALQAGVPVIGYNRGATSDLLAFGGGRTVEPCAEGLAAALVEWMSDVESYEKARASAEVAGERWRATKANFLIAETAEALVSPTPAGAPPYEGRPDP